MLTDRSNSGDIRNGSAAVSFADSDIECTDRLSELLSG